MQFKRLLLLLFSIHIGFPLSLNSVDLLKFCAMMCFHVPVFSGNCNRDYVLLQSESIWGFGFSLLTGEDSHIFCFHILLFNFSTFFYLPFPGFFPTIHHTFSQSCNSAHSWKKRDSYHLGIGYIWNELVSFYVFMVYFFFCSFFLFKLG